MTASYIAAGAAVHGDNTSLHPAFPAGIVAGDTIVIVTEIRNTAAFAGDVNTPGGWTQLLNLGHVVVVAQEWDGQFTAPTCVFTGGIAGDTTSAQCFALRGVKVSLNGTPASITNVSAQNVATPAFTPLRNGGAVLVGMWKQDDFTSVATLAGLTEAAEASTVTGNDQGHALDYVIQTAPATIGATSFVVTGGAAAVSKGWALALNAAPVITVDPQDIYPQRVLITVTGLTVGDQVAIYRVALGERVLVRAGSTDAAADVAFLVIDAELPFGTPVYYVAVVEDMEVASASVTYVLPGAKVALSDAISSDSAEVVIGAWPEKDWTRDASVLRPGGRNVAVLQEFGQYQSELELYTETDIARENLEALLRSATNGILQLRAPDVTLYPGVDTFLVVLAFKQRRWSQDGSDPRRLWALTVAEVDGWAPTLAATGFTYADLEAAYAGLTYANLASDYAGKTYLDLAQADLS
jgi:hypothetical protein